jgi:hypothetical protein
MYYNLSETSSVVAERCLRLLEEHCPRLMREGGGALSREAEGVRVFVSPSIRRRIVALRRKRWAVLRIAAAVGCSATTVSKTCRAAGVRRMLIR